MGIKGMTDGGATFPRLGILRKGAPKPERGPGKDLQYFRFDTDDKEAEAAFRSAYGDEPNYIHVYLPYVTTEENFSAWREAWTASSLQHRCDGETMTRWLGRDGKYSDEPQPCPRDGACKPVGRLTVIIPELRRLAYVVAQTTSINDIVELHANLKAAEMLRGTLRGIPFVLSRRPREISTPRAGGQRARVEKWLLSIEPAQQWVGYQLQAMERAALPEGTLRALPDGGQVNTITGEIVDDAPPDDDTPEATVIEQAVTAAQDKPLTANQRAAAGRKIRKLWAQERGLTEDITEQNRETSLDLEELADADLVALGQAVSGRVAVLEAQIENVAVLG